MAAPSKATVAANAPLTKAQLLDLHPWPAEFAEAKKIERLWTFELPGTPSVLWPLLSDTSRLNRALGTAEMTFIEKDGKRYGSSKNGGVKHEWLEVPWNWVAEQWLTSTRLYERGFMKASYAIHRLEPIDRSGSAGPRSAAEGRRGDSIDGGGGTRVYLYYGCVPRGALGAAALRLGFPTLERAYRRVLPQVAAQLDRLKPEVLVAPAPALSDDAEVRLRAGREQLVGEGLPGACIDALVGWIRTGDEIDLHRIQIRERARVWKLPEVDLLRTALHATRAGLLDLSWDTICPHCRGLREETDALGEIAADGHCEVCNIDFTTDRIEAIEVTFRVHPSVREIADRLYCSAEPATKDHIRVQATVAAGATHRVRPRLQPGRYTVWAGRRGGWYLDVDADGPGEVAWADHSEGTVVRACPEPAVELANRTANPEVFTIQRATWSDDALRPGALLSFQEFRDLFSEQYIGADVKLAVGEQTILFTDVVGSTAFYAAQGDPAAFVEIKRHFDEVFDIVRKSRGAVIKTIGDAVMATFVNPVDALRASRGIHDAFSPARDRSPIRLRISLNTGPCIAVRLNSNIDFFGGTVNVAAKLQALAESYQVALSDATYRAAGVADYLAEQNAELEDLSYESKALREPVAVKRWTIHRDA